MLPTGHDAPRTRCCGVYIDRTASKRMLLKKAPGHHETEVCPSKRRSKVRYEKPASANLKAVRGEASLAPITSNPAKSNS